MENQILDGESNLNKKGKRKLFKTLIIIISIIGVLVIGFYSYLTYQFGKSVDNAIHHISKKIVELENDTTNNILDSITDFIEKSNFKLDSLKNESEIINLKEH